VTGGNSKGRINFVRNKSGEEGDESAERGQTDEKVFLVGRGLETGALSSLRQSVSGDRGNQ